MEAASTLTGSPTASAAAQVESQKRRQILEGATRAFLSLGFNGASMGEIARLSGVSKGTLYVYFQNKEQLFVACIEEKRRTTYEQLLDFDVAKPLVEELTQFGTRLARFLSSAEVIMAMRTVIGIAEQMPDLGERFYDNGPARAAGIFAKFLQTKVDAGVLDIADTFLAATQFTDLCQSTLVRPLLFGGAMSETEKEDRIAHSVSSAVDIFLRAHRSAS